jgi:hypothetical protein
MMPCFGPILFLTIFQNINETIAWLEAKTTDLKRAELGQTLEQVQALTRQVVENASWKQIVIIDLNRFRIQQ